MKQVFITGGDGYLGQRLAKKYLASGEYQVLLWIRARNDEESNIKLDQLKAVYGAGLTHLKIFWGDLAQAQPFDGIDTTEIEHIIHAAAVIAFNVDKETASQVNIEGTRKLLDFARQCPNLKALGLISSLYASGLCSGSVSEQRFTASEGHANYYEWSKWSAEELLFNDYGDLPWKILRVGTIIADDAHGNVTQHNAIHNTLKLFYYGLLSIVPGKEQTPLYLATGEYVTAGIYQQMHQQAGNRIVHLTHDKAAAVTLGQFIDIAYAEFNGSGSFSSRKIMKPLYADMESFDLLAKGVADFGGALVKRALVTVKPFSAQLFIDKDIKVSCCEVSTDQACLPDMMRVIRNTCAQLMNNTFKQVTSHAAG